MRRPAPSADAPPASVAAAFADPATLSQLFAHLRGVEPVGASGARVLPKLTAQALGLPDTLSATRSMDPDAGVVTWQSGDGDPVAFTLTARAGEARDGGTRLTLSARYSAARRRSPPPQPDLARLLDADLARAGGPAGAAHPAGARRARSGRGAPSGGWGRRRASGPRRDRAEDTWAPRGPGGLSGGVGRCLSARLRSHAYQGDPPRTPRTPSRAGSACSSWARSSRASPTSRAGPG